MPIREYRCKDESCGTVFEYLETKTGDEPRECVGCGGKKLEKIALSGFGIGGSSSKGDDGGIDVLRHVATVYDGKTGQPKDSYYTVDRISGKDIPRAFGQGEN